MPGTQHSFHIPVMGTCFTMDTPLRVGRYGIHSVMSLGDDRLLELFRKYWLERRGKPFKAIEDFEPHVRSRRLQAWCDLVADELETQSLRLQREPLKPGSDLWRYFELLPDGPARQSWKAAAALPPGEARELSVSALRSLAVPGRADVNIMTKVDRDTLPDGSPREKGDSDALAALRGFAQSRLKSGVVFSAGINPRLYGYCAEFPAFLPGPEGQAPTKEIILKVSDFRSAEVQGKFLAKKGLWISEFRVESGLNCGGHAFGGDGALLGPVLDEFLEHRKVLNAELFALVQEALRKAGKPLFESQPVQRLTAQGGVGTAEEHEFLKRRYRLDSVGWGSPFMLVPEVVRIDEETLSLMEQAGEDDIFLSGASPLGIPFWNLRQSSSERTRERRIAEGKPGSPCPQGYLAFDARNPSGRPLCHAASAYTRLALAQIEQEPDAAKREDRKKALLAKSCICLDLGGAARRALFNEPAVDAAVCPGPNLAYYSRRASLAEMVDHIYGRASLPVAEIRPSMFVKEFDLSLDQCLLRKGRREAGLEEGNPAADEAWMKRLADAAEYYKKLEKDGAPFKGGSFQADLDAYWKRLGKTDRFEALIKA